MTDVHPASVRALRTGALLFALGLTACSAAPTASAQDVATGVAATVQAMNAQASTVEALGTVVSDAILQTLTAEGTMEVPPTPARAPALYLAYTDGGNVALFSEPGPAISLTSSGSVESVRISDDGGKIAYTRRPASDGPVELRVVNSDGSGDSLLMSPADFDALYPLDGAVHHDLSQFDFLPGTHNLLLNTRSTFEGPGLAKHDDLIQVDTDTLARTMLLAPGNGGDFTPSPDGQYLAVVRPNTIEIRLANGTPTVSGVITYTPVTTYSEYAYYAQPVWDRDSMTIGVAIPSSDPLAPATTGSIWRLPVGGTASLAGTITGQFFLLSGSEPLVSPDLSHVVYARPTATPNIWNLYLASVDGSGESLIDLYLVWGGWSADAQHFVFSRGDATSLQLGDLTETSTPLVNGTELRWFTPTEFILLSGSMGGWTLNRAGIGSAPLPLTSPAGDFIDYDFAYE